MLEKIVDYQVAFYGMGAVFVLGVLGRLITSFALRRMLREAERIHSSEHRLMKLIKAKYEHANLIADRVKNVDAFVDKYLFAYKLAGVSLYSWLSLPIRMLWLVLALGLAGFALECGLYGFGEHAFVSLGMMGVFGMLLFLLHVMSNQEQQLEGVRTYLVDYLDNVCAHRYQKPDTTKSQAQTRTDEKEPIVEAKVEVSEPEAHEKENLSQEMQIREILEEFLA